MAKFCPKCGKELEAGSKFCTGCGSPIGNAATVNVAPKVQEKRTKKKKKRILVPIFLTVVLIAVLGAGIVIVKEQIWGYRQILKDLADAQNECDLEKLQDIYLTGYELSEDRNADDAIKSGSEKLSEFGETEYKIVGSEKIETKNLKETLVKEMEESGKSHYGLDALELDPQAAYWVEYKGMDKKGGSITNEWEEKKLIVKYNGRWYIAMTVWEE